MKITKFELEKIIKEEIQDLQEIDFLKKIFGKSKDTNDTDDDFGAEEKQTKKILESLFKSRDVNEDIMALEMKDKQKKTEENKNNNKGLMSKGDE